MLCVVELNVFQKDKNKNHDVLTKSLLMLRKADFKLSAKNRKLFQFKTYFAHSLVSYNVSVIYVFVKRESNFHLFHESIY